MINYLFGFPIVYVGGFPSINMSEITSGDWTVWESANIGLTKKQYKKASKMINHKKTLKAQKYILKCLEINNGSRL